MTERSDLRRFPGALTVWLLAVTLLAPVTGRASGLDEWAEQNLLPWLTGQLADHPRFKGEPVRVAVFRGAEEDPTPDLLSAGLVDDLERELSRHPDIRLVHRPAGPDWDNQRLPTRLPCLPAAETYVVAVESRAMPGAMADVQVRILDTGDSEWVPGAVREWHGRLTGDQQRALGQKGVRDDLRGRRELPYRSGQEDLLAARAAHALGCALLAHPADNLTVWPEDTAADDEAGRIARLVPRYLARSGVLRLAGSRSEANMVLAVDFQPLDAEMRQVWIALGPADGSPELPSVRTSFYASAPQVALASSRPVTADGSRAPDAGLVLELVQSRCRDDGCREDDFLEVRSPGARHVELIAVARDGAILRLYPAPCPTEVMVDEAGVLRWPLTADDRQTLLAAFAVAAGTRDGADALRREFGALPTVCDGGGIRGAAARGRLVALERRLAPYTGDIHWRQVRIALPAGEQRLARAGQH